MIRAQRHRHCPVQRGSRTSVTREKAASDRLARRLLLRIQRRFETVTQPLDLEPLRLTFTRVADPDRVLDEVAEEADRHERRTGHHRQDEDLHLPYWAELWDSALGVARFLVEGSPRPDESVLDLGCGMGLAGVAAAALGARVLFADIEPPALLFARLNSLPWFGHVRTRRLNWRTDRLSEKFETILGSDILYERQQWEYLDAFWRGHLAPAGRVVLGEPGRQTGDKFMSWILRRGWQLRVTVQNVPTRPAPIRVLCLT
jgi:predicted nicotinamide N-methyase